MDAFEELKIKLAAHNFPSMSRMGEECNRKIDNIITGKFKSINSRKAKLFLKNRMFGSTYEDAFFFFSVDFINENTKQERIEATTVYLLPIKTKGGTIYAARNKFGIYTGITAHFFDRYVKRTGRNLTRKEAIKSFSKDALLTGTLMGLEKLKDGYIHMFIKDGVCLGEHCDNITLFKTFVSNDMFNQEQKESLKKNMGQPLPPISEQKLIQYLIEKDSD